MLNELVTWVLNTYLGKYLENFNPAQLSVALLSGEVELENVPIRRDALCALGIPIQAFSGNIGKIKLQVPVRNFRTASWCITIEHVYAVFGPKDLNDWDDEKERNSEFEYKMSELDAREAQWRANQQGVTGSAGGSSSDNYYSTSYTNWLNCGTSLATNILENLELKLHDVHLRYEDNINVNYGGAGIAAGIKIAALTMQSCDENWLCKTQWANGNEGISFKLIELREFAIYWDRMPPQQECKLLKHKELLLNMNERCVPGQHRFLISPISARAQCKRERCKQPIRYKNRPRLSCEILIPAVRIAISDLQYQQMVECAAGLKYIRTIRGYRVRRPKSSIHAGGSCLYWWQYAAQCHGYYIRNRVQHMNIALENVKYMRIYRRLLENPNEHLNKDECDFKLMMEHDREINELQLLRDVCCQYIYMKNLSKAKNLNNQNRGGRSMLFHWFPNWLGWYGTNNINNNVQIMDNDISATTTTIETTTATTSLVGTTVTTTTTLTATTPTSAYPMVEDGSTTTTTTTISLATITTSKEINNYNSNSSASTSPITANSENNSSTNSNNNNNYNSTLLDVDYQNIENDLLNALENSVEYDSFSKRDAVFGYLTFILVNGQFIITSERTATKTTSSIPITKMEMDFQQLTSVIEIKPRFSNYTIGISMGSVCLRDMITNGTKFPYLIRPQADNNSATTISGSTIKNQQQQQYANIKQLLLPHINSNNNNNNDTDNMSTSATSPNTSSEPWFELKYEKGPLDISSDVRLVVKSRSLDIVYNKEAFEWLAKFITKPIIKYERRNAYKNISKQQQKQQQQQQTLFSAIETPTASTTTAAVEKEPQTRLRFLENWKHLLMGNKVQQRKSWSYEIDISAPQIIFVENFLEKQTTIVLVDFGRFQLMKNKSRRKDSMSASVGSTTSVTNFGKNVGDNFSKTQNLENIYENSCDINNENAYDDYDDRTTIDDVREDEDENEDQFMTPCETPPGSEISLSDSPTNSQITGLPDDDINIQNQLLLNEKLTEAENYRLENAFHNRLYDKYFINLTDMQILICRVTILEKSGNIQMRTQTSSNCHLLDRFNITLRIERRILYTVDPEYPPLTVSATLPKLVAHIDEQNINTFLKIVYPLLTSRNVLTTTTTTTARSRTANTTTTTTAKHNNNDDDTKADIKSSTATLKTDFYGSNNLEMESDPEPSYSDANLIVGQFQIGQMILEMKSLKKSIAEMQIHGINVGITRRVMDTHLTMSVHGLLLVDAIQSFGPDFELLVASHRHVGMDSISGSLKRSEPCSPNAPESPDPMGNCRPMSPKTINQAVNGLQNQAQSDFHFNADSTPALITVEINHVQASPDDEPITFATINFYNLDVIANQETIVELLSFFNHILCTMEYYRNKYNKENMIKTPTSTIKNTITQMPEKQENDENYAENGKKSQRIEISFEFHRLNVLVMRTIKYEQQNYVIGRKVGTLTMSEAKIDATLGDDREMSISGSLGGIQIIDITPEGINHQRIFSVGKDPLTDPPTRSQALSQQHGLLSALTNEVYGRTHDINDSCTTTYDSCSNALMFQVQRQGQHDALCLKIRMASVWYTHCPRFMHEISECISQFKHYLKGFVRSVRNKATNIAMEFVHSSNEFPNEMNFDGNSQRITFNMNSNKSTAGKLSLDIILKSPVIVLPRSSSSTEVFVANLGEISVFNTHEEQYNNLNNNDDNEEQKEQQQQEQQQDAKEINRIERQTRDNYHINVRNINLFSLNTLNRKDLNAGALPKAHEFYSCANEAQPILHDTALGFTFTKDTRKTIELDKCRYETLLTVDGSVTQILQVSLTRAQYKQLKESLQNATNCAEIHNNDAALGVDHHDVANQPQDTIFFPEHVLVIEEEKAADELDGVKIIPQEKEEEEKGIELNKQTMIKQRINLGTRLNFSMPELKMHLRSDNSHDLMEISFSEFRVQYNCVNMEKNIEILLRSIIVEDLKVSPRSRFRHMVNSSCDDKNNNSNSTSSNTNHNNNNNNNNNIRKSRACSSSCRSINRLLTTSKSCPNFIGSCVPLYKCYQYASLPDHLDAIAGAGPINKSSRYSSSDDIDSMQDTDVKFMQCNFENDFLPKATTSATITTTKTTTTPIDKNLVIYKAHTVDKNELESITRSSIDFNCLNLIISVERWFTVLDFFGIIDTSQEKQVRGTSSKTQITNIIRKNSSKLKVTVRALNLILVRNESELAKANVSNVYLKICQGDIVEAVEGRLGSISLYDLTNFGYLYREKFSTSGPEALNFHYKRLRFGLNNNERSLEKDSVLTLQMSSVRYIHTKRFLSEVHIFINELLQLQTPVINHMKVSELEKSTLTRSLQIGLEIHAAAPIILLPMSYDSSQLIIADLGKLTVKNKFHYANDYKNVISRWKSNVQQQQQQTSQQQQQSQRQKSTNNRKDINFKLLNKNNKEKQFIEILDVMHVDLLNINLFAGEWQQKSNVNMNIMMMRSKTNISTYYCEPCLYIGDYVILKKGNSLFEEPCYLKLQIERNTDARLSHQCADLSVQGTLSKLNGIIHLQQYRLIRGFLNYNLGEDISDVYNKCIFNLQQQQQQQQEQQQHQQQQPHNVQEEEAAALAAVKEEEARKQEGEEEEEEPILTECDFILLEDATPVWKTMSISLLLENVSLLIALEQQQQQQQPQQQQFCEETIINNLKPLASIKFIKSALEIDSYSDGAQDIDLISSEILLLDSRKEDDADNVFKYILQPMQIKKSTDEHHGHNNYNNNNNNKNNIVQAEIHSRRRGNHSKYTILLNNMRIMAILDCMERLKNFLQAEPHMPNKIIKSPRKVQTSNDMMKTQQQEEDEEKFDEAATTMRATTSNSILTATPSTTTTTTTTSNKDIVIDNNTMEIVLNITNSELVFVEKLNQLDTNAIILKSTTVFSYKLDKLNNNNNNNNNNSGTAPISVDINHMEVFSCILGEEERSALSIIDPFTLNIELKEHRLNMLIPKQLCVRLSYNDIKLFSRMLQSVPQQTHNKQQQQKDNFTTALDNNSYKEKTKNFNDNVTEDELIAPLIAMGFSVQESWEAMQHSNYQLNDAANFLLQQQRTRLQNYKEESDLSIYELELSADRIYCCIIDDCMDADVPLLECSFAQLKYIQQLNKSLDDGSSASISGLKAQLTTIYACDYYNRRLSGWEPIIESWPCTATWVLEARQSLQLYLESKQLLRFNVTTTLIELCEMVRKNWTQDYYNNDQQRVRRTPFVPFALQNHTGESLLFKTIFAQPGGIMRKEITQQDMMNNWISVEPMQMVNFDFGPQTKLRHMDSHKLNVHQMLVQINGWNLIGPISIDKVGVYFRTTTRDKNYTKRTRIVFDICLEGSAQKLITVKSALNVINKLDRGLMLKMELRPGERHEWCQLLAPHERLTVPLRYVDTLLYLKPHGPGSMEHNVLETNEEARVIANMGFCTRGIAWQECGKEPLQELYTCYGQHKQLFHMMVEVRPDKYAMREKIPLSGHTISVLAPLKLRNLLCCELIYCLEDQIKGRVAAGSTAYIYDVNMQQSVNISLTLDNYQVSGQLKIPLGHSGVVEPKLKLIDVNNRELLLRVSIQHFPGNGMEIFVSAPTWLINKTGLPLMFRQEGSGHLASGQFEEHETARVVTPLLFSFSDQEGSPALEMRLGQRYGENNQWCKSFNIHKEVAFRELRAENSKGCFAVGINVRRGRGIYSCTTFITLSPRFQLYNRTKHRLELAQKCDVIYNGASVSDNFIEALQDSNFPFHWPNYEQEPLLCIRILDIPNCEWSHGIPINEAQSLYLNIRNDDGDMWFLRLEVISRQATFLLLFTDAKLLPPPIRIDNYSEVQVTFNQTNCRPYWNTPVRPQSSLAYALDNPMGTQSLQIEAPDGNVIEYALNKLEVSRSLTYANFIYIAFKETFALDESNIVEGMEPQQLVLDVRDKRVILTRKRAGNRSQLWLMNSNGQLEHEGSSPPAEYNRQGKRANHAYGSEYSSRMVLDLETAPKPMDATCLVIRPPNKQRVTTQTWRFVNGRLMCYANMCVQPKNGIYGLCEGTEAVLARITQPTGVVPCEQAIEIQKFRPGSGHLEVSGKMDGPIFTIQIRDIKSTNHATVNDGTSKITTTMHALDNVGGGGGGFGRFNYEALLPDPQWQHASMQRQNTSTTTGNCVTNSSVAAANNEQETAAAAVWFKECNINLLLQNGVGISVVTRLPGEELAYITLEDIAVHVLITPRVKSLDLCVQDLQIDNQLLDTTCPVLLHTIKKPQQQPTTSSATTATKINDNNNNDSDYGLELINNQFAQQTLIKVNTRTTTSVRNAALCLRGKMLTSPNRNAVIFEYLHIELSPCAVYLEERLILKTALFLGLGKLIHDDATTVDTTILDPQQQQQTLTDINIDELTRNAIRYYFESLTLGPTQVRLSVLTASKLTNELLEVKKALGLTLIKFEDALIEFDSFSVRHQFKTTDLYIKALRTHYVNQLKWHAAAILGSVDFLGNPWGFANDLSEGVSSLIFEGSVKSLVKNVTHGISNSTAKLTETLSDSLGRVVLDEHDNETRQKILELQANTSGGHLAAGLKGFGFGLLGGVTSIVHYTYMGAVADGFPGFLSGLGKGLVGTVTKPIIGVLDLASETANAVRETSKNSNRSMPARKRLPRCVTGAPGGLLPNYSYRQAKGQQYLYVINRRNFSEKLMSYEPNLCNDQDTKLRLLISTDYIRIFSRCDEDPAIMLECHLAEVLSCHPVTTNVMASTPIIAGTSSTPPLLLQQQQQQSLAATTVGGAASRLMPGHYIEISINLPKITRPRVRCQNEQTAERAARAINYAKSCFDERVQSVTLD